MKNTLLAAVLTLSACGPLEPGERALGVDDTSVLEQGLGSKIPSEDVTRTVDVGSWNLEWFGAVDQGPSNEALQQANATRALRELSLDLVGLVEVVDAQAFQTMLAGLPAYDGLLVTDPRVTGGTSVYSAREQKVALLFKKRFHVDSARVVVTEAAYDFGGRPPLEVKLSFTEAGQPRTLVVLVAHFKAMANFDGWTRRTRASEAFKSWLDATYPTRWVLVVGDLNDDIDVSTYQRRTSPFSNFVADTANWQFTTAALTASNQSTTATFSSTIDHHLVTNELSPRFIPGSAKVIRLDQFIPSYATTTSDHFPVVTRYDLGAARTR